MGGYSDIITSAFELGCFYSSFTNEPAKKKLNKISWFAGKLMDNVSRGTTISLNSVVEYVKDTQDIGSFFLPELLEWRRVHNENGSNIYMPEAHVAILLDSGSQVLPRSYRQDTRYPLFIVHSTSIDFLRDRILSLTNIIPSNDTLVHGGELTCLSDREDGVRKIIAIIRQMYGIDIIERYRCPPDDLQEEYHRLTDHDKRISSIYNLCEQVIDERGISEHYVDLLKASPGKKEFISLTGLSWNILQRLGIRPEHNLAYVLGMLKRQELDGSRQSMECAQFGLEQMVTNLKKRKF